MGIVARKELEEVSEHLEKVIDPIISSAVFLHNSSSTHFQVSPQKFVNFIQQFKNILAKTIATSSGKSSHLIAGLEKLKEAEEMVAILSKSAGEKKIELGHKKKEADAAMK
jgi:hypothetical protein